MKEDGDAATFFFAMSHFSVSAHDRLYIVKCKMVSYCNHDIIVFFKSTIFCVYYIYMYMYSNAANFKTDVPRITV